MDVAIFVLSAFVLAFIMTLAVGTWLPGLRGKQLIQIPVFLTLATLLLALPFLLKPKPQETSLTIECSRQSTGNGSTR